MGLLQYVRSSDRKAYLKKFISWQKIGNKLKVMKNNEIHVSAMWNRTFKTIAKRLK